jgi:antitoxin VapB
MHSRGEKAKLFKHGGSQAVRLPKKYRFERQKEVIIHREGERVILEPIRRGWSRRFLDLAGSALNFPYSGEPPPADSGPDLE